MLFDYPSAASHAEGLYFVAKRLGNEIILRRSSGIALIGHSLGGLVVRKLLSELCNGTKFHSGISSRTRLVALFASPYTGSSLAGFAKYIPYAMNHPHLQILEKNDGALNQMNDAWELWHENNVSCHIMKFRGSLDKVVPSSDALAGPGENYPVPNEDHSSIVKPTIVKLGVVKTLAEGIRQKFLN